MVCFVPAKQEVYKPYRHTRRPMLSVVPTAAADSNIWCASEKYIAELIEAYQQVVEIEFHGHTITGNSAINSVSVDVARVPAKQSVSTW